MADLDRQSASTPDSGRVLVGLWCDLHPNPDPCPAPELMELTGEIHKLRGNAFFCERCPVYQAIIERHGIPVQ